MEIQPGNSNPAAPQSPVQTGQVQVQLVQGVVSFLAVAYLGAWVFSQVKKAFKGQDVEKPF